jgi:transcription-repair coupling factor (superfamily II helicase)
VINLCKLTHILELEHVYQELLTRLKKGGQNESRALITDAAKPFLIASLYQNLKRPLFVITAQPENAKKLAEQISLWCDSAELSLFQESDQLPYQRSVPDFSIEQDRLQVLYSLARKESAHPW